jgi:hypothetical protein
MRLFLILLAASSIGYSETQTLEAAKAVPKSDARILGSLEFRPSLTNEKGEAHTEDNAIFGYQFTRDTYISYKQEFSTNLYNPMTPNISGVGIYATDGYFRGGVANILRSGSWSLGYEGRLYMPTWGIKRDAGMLTVIRNYAKIAYQVTPDLTIGLDEAPFVVDVYDHAGSTANGRAFANPAFENKADLWVNYFITRDLRLFIPLKFTAKKNREFSSKAAFDGAWSYNACFWPELWYRVAANYQVGAAYYTDNLIAPDFSRTTVSDGFRRSVTQLILAVNI